MNYSEFRVMTTALEKYYKDVKIAILTGKREAKDLDMRYTRAKLFIYLTQKVHVAYIDLLSEVVLAQLASFFDVTRSIHRGHNIQPMLKQLLPPTSTDWVQLQPDAINMTSLSL